MVKVARYPLIVAIFISTLIFPENAHASSCTVSNYQSSTPNVMIYVFTSPDGTTATCTWNNPYLGASADELIVGGGGGGGGDVSGGGGAGGLLYFGNETSTNQDSSTRNSNGAAITLTLSSYSVQVGGGGAATSSQGTDGGKGGDSTFGSNTATGGGGGRSRNTTGTNTANNGGSGGGGGYGNGTPTNGGTGTTNQGFAGGKGDGEAGGGGGGAGGTGYNRSGTSGGRGSNTGQGGDGLKYSITDTPTWYAGGGGAGAWRSQPGEGGQGGGGRGGAATNAACIAFTYVLTNSLYNDCGSTDLSANTGISGTNGTGGGGGGSGNFNTVPPSGKGGSGIVILRISIIPTPASVNSISASGSIVKNKRISLTANVSVAGTVAFYAGGRPITRCGSISTTGTSPNIIAVCSWLPITTGNLSLSATITPSVFGYSSGSSSMNSTTSKRAVSR